MQVHYFHLEIIIFHYRHLSTLSCALSWVHRVIFFYKRSIVLNNPLRSLFGLLLLIAMTLPAFAKTAPISPNQMMQSVSEHLFQNLKQLNKDDAQRKQKVSDIVTTHLMPHMDTKYVAYKLLGKHIRSINKPQAMAFIEGVNAYLTGSYTQVLSQYTSQEIIIEPTSTQPSGKLTQVKARIISEHAPSIDLVFKLRKNKKTQQWKIYDLVAEGISLLDAKQKEIVPKITQLGIEKVTKSLSQK